MNFLFHFHLLSIRIFCMDCYCQLYIQLKSSFVTLTFKDNGQFTFAKSFYNDDIKHFGGILNRIIYVSIHLSNSAITPSSQPFLESLIIHKHNNFNTKIMSQCNVVQNFSNILDASCTYSINRHNVSLAIFGKKINKNSRVKRS